MLEYEVCVLLLQQQLLFQSCDDVFCLADRFHLVLYWLYHIFRERLWSLLLDNQNRKSQIVELI